MLLRLAIVADREGVAELRSAAAADAEAPALVGQAVADRRLRETASGSGVVDGRRDQRDVRTHHLRVVPAGNRAVLHLLALAEAGVLEADAQRLASADSRRGARAAC